MAFDSVHYITQKMREYDPSIDVSTGSAVRDLMINPLSSLLDAFNETHQIFENRLSLANISGLSQAAVDDIAANMLVYRSVGAKCTGYVRIYFKDAQNLVIPRNTEFRTLDGRAYLSVNEYSVTRTQMLANIDRYPLYHTGNILVKAQLEGTKYQIGPQEIVSIRGFGRAYELVTNPNAFTGASDRESNDELYEKIVDSVHNTSLASAKGIAKQLRNTFGNITDVLVVGANDDLMLRDVIQNTTRPDVTSYAEVDYSGKILGQNESPYKLSRAYYGLFIDENLSNSGYVNSEFPIPSTFTREYSQEQYSQIFAEDSFVTALTPSQVLVYETFGASGYDPSWSASDETMGLNTLAYSGEITILNGAIYMGNNPDRPGVFLPFQMIAQISGYLDQIAKRA